MSENNDRITPISWVVNGMVRWGNEREEIYIKKIKQREGTYLFGIYDVGGSVFDKQDMEFCYDPMPSNRPSNYAEIARFNTIEECLKALDIWYAKHSEEVGKFVKKS